MSQRELKSLIITATNSVLGDKTNHVDEHIMDHFITSAIINNRDEKDVGFITAQKYAIKTGLQKSRWEQIRGALKFWGGGG